MSAVGTMRMLQRLDVLGVQVSSINMELALDTIEQWIEAGEQHYVCITGVHGVMESRKDPALREIHNRAGLVTPDGMPLVWLNWMQGRSHVDRVYGPDLMLACCQRFMKRGGRHYFYGGNEGVPEKLAGRLAKRFPGLLVAGTYSPPFRPLTPLEDDEIVRMINDSGADIVWVGLSTPKQERWMHEHAGRLNAPVMVGVGAAFDFHAGLKSQAPRWMQRSGLEWSFRLATEPRRLWKRYLSNNPRFVALILAEWFAARVRRKPAPAAGKPIELN
jgi:N-acetylglucosaminyldiphosphoundecaprenol N-acetyl-beta-D-mannosaminyltransferase